MLGSRWRVSPSRSYLSSIICIRASGTRRGNPVERQIAGERSPERLPPTAREGLCPIHEKSDSPRRRRQYVSSSTCKRVGRSKDPEETAETPSLSGVGYCAGLPLTTTWKLSVRNEYIPTQSYLKGVSYDLRPAKQVERRMLIDAFHRLASSRVPHFRLPIYGVRINLFRRFHPVPQVTRA